jgi:hypothetical protein
MSIPKKNWENSHHTWRDQMSIFLWKIHLTRVSRGTDHARKQCLLSLCRGVRGSAAHPTPGCGAEPHGKFLHQ